MASVGGNCDAELLDVHVLRDGTIGKRHDGGFEEAVAVNVVGSVSLGLTRFAISWN